MLRIKLDKRSKTIIIIVLIIGVILIGCGFTYHLHTIKKLQKQFEEKTFEMQNRILNATRGVYLANSEIKTGQTIMEANVTYVPDYLCEQDQSVFITEEDIGKEAVVNIPASTPITVSMIVSSVDKDVHEAELDCVWLSSNLGQYDFVDIRILYPNGTDYVVVSKKSVQQLDLSINNAFFWLTEEEILQIDSAIVDANLHGGKIYTTKYIKPEIQEATIVNYVPTEDIIDLIRDNPNIVQQAKDNLSKTARSAIEDKLEAFKDAKIARDEKDNESNYDFHLDTTTDATTGEKTDNNNGTEVKEDENTDIAEENTVSNDENTNLQSSRNANQ